MKKSLVCALLTGAMCMTFAGCDLFGKTGVTEKTDPASIVGEKTDREGWEKAFAPQGDFGLRTVIRTDKTEEEGPMSETLTLDYRFASDKIAVTVTQAAGGKTLYETEGYAEVDDGVTFWQRSREGGEWSEWESETYAKEDLSQIFGAEEGLSFAREHFADFSYDEASMGYAATASGLEEMAEELGVFSEHLLSVGGDGEIPAAKSFVVKLTDGRPSACLLDFSVGAPAAQTESEGDDAEEGEKETITRMTLTQVYYGYGETEVLRPEGLPAVGASTLRFVRPFRLFRVMH